MPGRKYSSSSLYRYGFNGKENDNEVKGGGNQQDYGMRIYDTRLVRFLSVDPLTEEYPWYTPYQFAGNDVIRNSDVDGAEPDLQTMASAQKKQAVIQLQVAERNRVFRHGFFSVHKPTLSEKAYKYFNDPFNEVQFNTNPGMAAAKLIFTLADDIKVTGTSLASNGKDSRHIGGKKANFDERMFSFINVSGAILGPAISAETKPLTGGRYGDISKSEFFDVHEMPSKSTLKKFGIADGDAPGVKMPTPAHTKTGSFRNSRAAQAFRAKEETLIKGQKFDELWQMQENDYTRAMKMNNSKIDNTALKQAKIHYETNIVPKLKK